MKQSTECPLVPPGHPLSAVQPWYAGANAKAILAESGANPSHASLAAEVARLREVNAALLEACKEARDMAERLRKATGDAIPAGICFTLNQAISHAEGAL